MQCFSYSLYGVLSFNLLIYSIFLFSDSTVILFIGNFLVPSSVHLLICASQRESLTLHYHSLRYGRVLYAYTIPYHTHTGPCQRGMKWLIARPRLDSTLNARTELPVKAQLRYPGREVGKISTISVRKYSIAIRRKL